MQVAMKILFTILIISASIAMIGSTLIVVGLQEIGGRMYIGGCLSVLLCILVAIIFHVLE